MTDELFILFDKEDKCVGHIMAQADANPKKQGEFSPTREFLKYQILFTELESSANNILLTHAEKIEQKINSLAFYVRNESPREKLEIQGLQIMEGWAVFEMRNLRNS